MAEVCNFGSCTEVAAASNYAVSDVVVVRNLCSVKDNGVFHLHGMTNVAVFADGGSRT